MPKSDRVRLQHMLDAAREALSFVRGKTRGHLDRDRLLVLALVKAIEIIGEAAYQVSSETRWQIPEVPWEDIIGMRHRLVHAYFDSGRSLEHRAKRPSAADCSFGVGFAERR